MRILFLTDKYYPRPFANAICVQHVARSFVEAGHEVDVIAFDDPFEKLPNVLDGVGVHGVKIDWRLRLFYFVNDNQGVRLRKIAMGAFRSLNFLSRLANWSKYPLASKSLARRITRLAIELHGKTPYDCIVATYGPAECIEAAVGIREMLPHMPLVAYCVDYIPNALRRHIPVEKQHSAIDYWVDRIGCSFDYVIGMAFEREWYEKVYAGAKKARAIISDLPMLSESARRASSSPAVGDWVYAGSLSKGHYNPVPAMETFVRLKELGIVGTGVFHIVGRGDYEQLCREWEGKTAGAIRVHGYMTHDELEKMYELAAVLVSMKGSDQISAKVFEYMAQEKPILHFSEHPSDPDRGYVDRYPLGLSVDVLSVGVEERCGLIATWLASLGSRPLAPDWMMDFEANRPSFTRDLILDCLDHLACRRVGGFCS